MSAEPLQVKSLRKNAFVRGIAKDLKKHKYLYALLIPGIVWFLIYRYLPMLGLVIAFKEFNFSQGMFGGEWVGFKYFQFIFTEHRDFYRLVVNTLLINFYKLIIGFPIPIVVALMLNEVGKGKLKSFMQTSLYLPHFVSWVIFGGIIVQFLSPSSGVVNEIIKAFGGEPIFFMTTPEYFRSILVATDIWKSAGWNTIIFLAAIVGVDQSLYEAATIDGAGKFKQIWHVTLPGISETIVVLLLLNIGIMMTTGFEQIYVLYNPTVYSVGDVLNTYVYRVGIGSGRFSLTTAIGLFQSFVGLVLIFTCNFLMRRVFGKSLW